MRIESAVKMRNGGWAHHFGTRPTRVAPMPLPECRPEIDAAALMGKWKQSTPMDAIRRHATALGVSHAAFMALGVAWAIQYRAWAYPMQDGQGNIVGIRLRDEQGRKWAVTGSRSGIFVPQVTPQDFVLVCEGPTDTAAALSMGFYAIGRPSCLQGAEQIRLTCLRIGIRRVVIVSDKDQPGIKGATECAKQIRLQHKFFMPPAKDLRRAYAEGLTRQVADCTISQSKWLLDS